MSKHVPGGKGSDSYRQASGGRAGRSPGRGPSGAGTGTGMARGRPPRGWGSKGGPAGKTPEKSGFLNWLIDLLFGKKEKE